MIPNRRPVVFDWPACQSATDTAPRVRASANAARIAPKCRFQPVFVEDLASAIARSALDRETHGGRTYEIGGPEILTMRELMAGILHASGRTSQLIVPA